MRLNENKIIKALRAIKQNTDGKILIQYLQELANDNYKEFQTAEFDVLATHQGYAKCIDNILESFEQCDKNAPRKKKETLTTSTI